MKEFEFIKTLSRLKYYNITENDLTIGDDAALLGNHLIAKDIIVSDIHFKRDAGMEKILFKLITSNVSDIAAMGGKPPFYGLLGLSVDGEIDLKQFTDALSNVLDFYKIDLIGGDTTGSKSGVFLSFTIIGNKNKYLLKRSGAKPGDILYLSRPVGLSLISLEKELNIINHPIDPHYHYKQRAEVDLGLTLGSLGYVTSCIDISDGLGRDLSHIAKSSNVNILVNEKLLHTTHLKDFDIIDPLKYILSSGEEYALAFTIDRNYEKDFEKIIQSFPDIHRIGHIKEGSGVLLQKSDGKLIDISSLGWEHL
jgi:thiamine-monophosphate kinase